MFGGFGVIVFLALTGIGMALQEGFLVGLGAMGALTVGLSWVWYRLCLEGLSYRREVASSRAFQGEEVSFSVELRNAKPLPLPRVRVDDDFPEEVELLEGDLRASARQGVFALTHSTALAWYESVRWTYQLRCQRRGYYRFGPARVTSGDLFGFFTADAHEPAVHHLLVYPEVIPLPELGLPARRPFGDLRHRSWLFQDQTRPIGARDYRPGDPMKLVDWKATARSQSLKVKELEATVGPTLVITLNLDTLGIAWRGHSSLLLERAVKVAASVAHEAMGQGQTVGLLTNGTSLLYERPMSLLPARDPRQYLLIFETLAMVGPYLSGPIEEVMLSHRARLPFGATVALVTGVFPPVLARALLELQRAGHATQVLYVGEDPPEAEAPITVPFLNLAPYLRTREAATNGK